MGDFFMDLLTETPKPSIVTIGTEPTPLPENPLSDRVGFKLVNTSSVNIFITDEDGSVSFPILPDGTIHFDAPDVVTVYAKVTTGSVDIPILELK